MSQWNACRYGAQPTVGAVGIRVEYQWSLMLKYKIQRTTALCINTPAETCAQIQQLSMSTPDNIKHLDLHLDKTILSTVEISMTKIEPKYSRVEFWPPHHWLTLSTGLRLLIWLSFLSTTMSSWHFWLNPCTLSTSSQKFFNSFGPSKWMDAWLRISGWLPKKVLLLA